MQRFGLRPLLCLGAEVYLHALSTFHWMHEDSFSLEVLSKLCNREKDAYGDDICETFCCSYRRIHTLWSMDSHQYASEYGGTFTPPPPIWSICRRLWSESMPWCILVMPQLCSTEDSLTDSNTECMWTHSCRQTKTQERQYFMRQESRLQSFIPASFYLSSGSWKPDHPDWRGSVCMGFWSRHTQRVLISLVSPPF